MAYPKNNADILDTSALIAFVRKRDAFHKKATQIYKDRLDAGHRFITTFVRRTRILNKPVLPYQGHMSRFGNHLNSYSKSWIIVPLRLRPLVREVDGAYWSTIELVAALLRLAAFADHAFMLCSCGAGRACGLVRALYLQLYVN